MTESCGTCRFHRTKHADGYSGLAPCRRFPPTAAKDHPRGGKVPVWPATSVHDWCGEWQERRA